MPDLKTLVELPEFYETIRKAPTSTLCIFDIDGVFFDGLADIHSYSSTIDSSHLQALKKISKLPTNIWIFTDRNNWGEWGNFKTQLSESLIFNKQTDVKTYSSSQDFIKNFESGKHNRCIIFDAKKGSKESVEVIDLAIKNFNKIFYIASQDFPWSYKDLNLLQKVSQKIKTDSITFIDIRRRSHIKILLKSMRKILHKIRYIIE